MRLKLLFVPLAATLALGACAKSSGSTSSGAKATAKDAAPQQDASAVVAQWGDQKITLGDLDDSIKAELHDLEKQKFETRKDALDAMVAKKLVEAEAKKRGVSEDDLYKSEIDAKVQEPSDEAAQALYDAKKSQIQGGAPPFEQVKDQIKKMLKQDTTKKAFFAFVDKLKTDAGVKLALAEPPTPRIEVAADGPARGPKTAPVTIVTFSDFECPFCGRAIPTVQQVMKDYDGKVRLVFRDFPLPFHQHAQKAAEAGQCAAAQGKFWELHDKMFTNQQALDVDKLKGYAKDLGMDSAKFDKCLDGGEMVKAVQTDAEAGKKAGVQGTPAFFVNGKMISGAQPYEEFKKLIDSELASAK